MSRTTKRQKFEKWCMQNGWGIHTYTERGKKEYSNRTTNLMWQAIEVATKREESKS